MTLYLPTEIKLPRSDNYRTAIVIMFSCLETFNGKLEGKNTQRLQTEVLDQWSNWDGRTTQNKSSLAEAVRLYNVNNTGAANDLGTCTENNETVHIQPSNSP